jgi:hypothetical protein
MQCLAFDVEGISKVSDKTLHEVPSLVHNSNRGCIGSDYTAKSLGCLRIRTSTAFYFIAYID